MRAYPERLIGFDPIQREVDNQNQRSIKRGNNGQWSLQMPLLRKVEKKVFSDAVVHSDGNAFIACEFHACTIVYHGGASHFDSCAFFGGTIWRLEFTVHDPDQWKAFLDNVAKIIGSSVPQIAQKSEQSAVVEEKNASNQ